MSKYEKLAGLDKNIFLIDLGLAEKYLDKNNKHRPQENVRKLYGCNMFQSVNALLKKTQSRRDDLIAMMYTLIYLDHVSWNLNYIRNDAARAKIILDIKMITSSK